MQARKLVSGHSTVEDDEVLQALELLVLENIIRLSLNIFEDQ